jgi:glycine oxidase
VRVVIIGAGVAGLSIGWRLCQSGAEVTILERAQAAQAATWAAAGMIAVAGEIGSTQTPEAEFARYSSSLWPDFAKELEAGSGREISYQRSGALIVARTAAENAAFVARAGIEHLDPAKALFREPMLAADIAGAQWAPDEAQVDNRALGVALADAFVRSGGTLSVNEPVVKFEVQDAEVVAVLSPFYRYTADAYVLAAGAWSSALGGLPELALPPVRPIKGEMIAVEPPPGVALPASVVWGNGVYLVPRAGRLLIGATMAEVGFDTSVTDAATEWLSSRAIALMPGLASWEIIDHWAGLRPGSPDGLPLLGRTPVARLFMATGQFRNGILFAPAIAEHMAKLVLGHTPEIPAFDPRRFAR